MGRQPLQGGRGDANLTAMLGKALESRERKEQEYRDQFVRKWAIIFVNVADGVKPLHQQGEEVVTVTLAQYRTIVSSIFQTHESCYVSPEGGALVVGGFEDPSSAVSAAIDVQRALTVWNRTRDVPLVPAIGINVGDVEVRDGILEQSNTCNLAKRIETEASPGQIYVSHGLAMFIDSLALCPVEFVNSAYVKNIPEPQDIFELHWEEAGAGERPKEGSRIKMAQPAPPPDKTISKAPSIKERLGIGRKAEQLAASLPSAGQEVTEDQVILVIDVCESSRKFWNLGDREANKLIRDYRNVVEPIAAKYRSTHCEAVEGDMIIVLFPGEKPGPTLTAAIEIQQVLLKRNLSLPDKQRVRAAVGLHLGEVKRCGREIVKGIAISTAKTLQGGAVEDQILISGNLYDRLENQMSYDLRFLMDKEFKDVSEPIPVYNLVWHRDSGSTSGLDQRKLHVGLQNIVRSRMDGQS